MTIKIKTFGWRNSLLDQISRIDNGLLFLNHQLTNEYPHIAYSNNDIYDDILEFSEQQKQKPFIILNVLDLQVDNKSYDLNKIKNQLIKADAITCISKTVQKQILDILNLKSHVIYNPVKNVFHDKKIVKQNLFLYVGRANDSRKRFSLIRQTFENHTNINNSLIICGSENPSFGNYIGIVQDADLNFLYNTSKFLLFPSSFEGLGLPMIESMICGCIPITCRDNPTAVEFSPNEFICDPNPESMLKKITEINNRYNYYQEAALEYGDYYSKIMNQNKIAENIVNIYSNKK